VTNGSHARTHAPDHASPMAMPVRGNPSRGLSRRYFARRGIYCHTRTHVTHRHTHTHLTVPHLASVALAHDEEGVTLQVRVQIRDDIRECSHQIQCHLQRQQKKRERDTSHTVTLVMIPHRERTWLGSITAGGGVVSLYENPLPTGESGRKIKRYEFGSETKTQQSSVREE
jgi:hypothetical protein